MPIRDSEQRIGIIPLSRNKDFVAPVAPVLSLELEVASLAQHECCQDRGLWPQSPYGGGSGAGMCDLTAPALGGGGECPVPMLSS